MRLILPTQIAPASTARELEALQKQQALPCGDEPRRKRRRRSLKDCSCSATLTAGPLSPPTPPGDNSDGPSRLWKPSGSRMSGQEVEEAAMHATIAHRRRHPRGLSIDCGWGAAELEAAYRECGEVTAGFAKTFYFGTSLMTPEKARGVWAIYVWCRRTDELVDGPNASRMNPLELDMWSKRLDDIFAGKPFDEYDAALTDTIARYPVPIEPFQDMIDGMRMDLVKSRYETFSELYEYCYKVAGTVGLMTTPVMGVDPQYTGPLEDVYRAALALGTANQLTNILRDVGEDAQERNRIYLPLQELDQFGISEGEVLTGMFCQTTGAIDDRWRRFMEFQIGRARGYFQKAEAGIANLDRDARLPVWAALILYRKILGAIEKNRFDNFTKRAYVPKLDKYLSLPAAVLQSNILPRGGRRGAPGRGKTLAAPIAFKGPAAAKAGKAGAEGGRK